MARPPSDLAVELSTADGLSLEALAVFPEPACGSLVACHPHPVYGGTMTNKVVHSLYKAFRDSGFASLRFNFRGAGASEGVHGHGETEVLDVAAAWDELAARCASLPESAPRVLGGFSFGSSVGLRYASEEERCTHRLGIGLPLALDLPDGRSYDFSWLSGDDKRPLYLLVGDSDEFCPQDRFERLVEDLRSDGVPVTAVVVPEANHFFDRKGHILRQEVERMAAAILGQSIPERSYPAVDV
jgi:alpha/beta superfamily hydrolase